MWRRVFPEIIVATPPQRMHGASGAVTRLSIRHDLELALASPNGVLVTTNVGHWAHEHESQIIANMIRHVLEHPPAQAK